MLERTSQNATSKLPYFNLKLQTSSPTLAEAQTQNLTHSRRPFQVSEEPLHSSLSSIKVLQDSYFNLKSTVYGTC